MTFYFGHHHATIQRSEIFNLWHSIDENVLHWQLRRLTILEYLIEKENEKYGSTEEKKCGGTVGDTFLACFFFFRYSNVAQIFNETGYA